MFVCCLLQYRLSPLPLDVVLLCRKLIKSFAMRSLKQHAHVLVDSHATPSDVPSDVRREQIQLGKDVDAVITVQVQGACLELWMETERNPELKRLRGKEDVFSNLLDTVFEGLKSHCAQTMGPDNVRLIKGATHKYAVTRDTKPKNAAPSSAPSAEPSVPSSAHDTHAGAPKDSPSTHQLPTPESDTWFVSLFLWLKQVHSQVANGRHEIVAYVRNSLVCVPHEDVCGFVRPACTCPARIEAQTASRGS